MVCRGNHELWANFTTFATRFAMPPARVYGGVGGPNGNLFFSVDVGALHLVLFNTETALDTGDISSDELVWLTRDLAAVNRSMTPFVVLGGHRPLYCTNGAFPPNDKDCGDFAAIMRLQAEKQLRDARVDLVLGAHMHGFERTAAVYGGAVVQNATANGTYVAPLAPVYIVNGAGGNREGNDNPPGNAPWSAPGAHFGTVGFGLMQVTPSRLAYQFVDSATGAVLDSMEILK